MEKTRQIVKKIKESRRSMCWVVNCLPCNTPFMDKESPHGCISCGMLDWLGAFDTEEECNRAYKEQYPNEFDSNGKYIG